MKTTDASSSTIVEAPLLPAHANDYQYSFAAAPDIIRSNQKDTYFQGVLLENFSDIIRKLYGARFSHNYTSEARTFTELLYLVCTTLLGNRTLGEEYCDIIQVEEDSLQFPSIYRRSGYILSTVLLPYVLNKTLPTFRNRIRLILESNLKYINRKDDHISSLPFSTRLQTYLLSNLSTLTSPSSFYALGLSIFYFSGAYYHISKRIIGLRYIFTKRLEPSEQRVGYEVLGVLLVLQMAVQGWLHFHNTMRSTQPSLANAATITGGAAVIDGGVEVSIDPHTYGNNNDLLLEEDRFQSGVSMEHVEHHTHTPVLSRPRYELKDTEKMSWIDGRQQRKCTLCLEELKDPSVTTCGHVFCWSCIADWIREKPECPLCRQAILSQHILPLRG
ncbi:peroxisome biogenesis factor 10 [Xylographa trunciseda]|nr:peroxisome biogenesis factor 10 [Xylographa trunciseda]